MKRPAPWATKLVALLEAGNKPAALAQIKAAPSLRDVQLLHQMLSRHTQLKKDAVLIQAVDDQITSLSHPRLHRSP